MQPLIEPMASMPLEATPTGDLFMPALEFAPDGRTLYVRQLVVPMRWTDWMRWYQPEIAAAVGLLALVWMVWWVGRVTRRPRERGRAYCRKCNYELTPPIAEVERGRVARWMTAEAKCPECGKRTRRVPVMGRGRVGRAAPAVVMSLLMIGMAAWGVSRALTPYQRFQGPTWPVAGIERLAPEWSYQRRRQRFEETTRVTAWEFAAGRSRTLCLAHERGQQSGSLSPDGRTMAVACCGTPPFFEGSLAVVDTQSGAVREVRPPGFPRSMPDLVGFSPDSGQVLVQWVDPGPGLKMYKMTLEAVDVATLSGKEVATVPVDYADVAGVTQSPYARFLVDGAGRWLLVVLRQDRGAGTVTVDVIRPEGDDTRMVSATVKAGSFFEPRLLSDGRVEVELFSGPGWLRIDPVTGATQTVTLPATKMVGKTEAWELRLPARNRVDVWDTSAGRTVATLTVPSGTVCGGAVVSKDGRYVAASVNGLKPGAKRGSVKSGDYETWVKVWDRGAR